MLGGLDRYLAQVCTGKVAGMRPLDEQERKKLIDAAVSGLDRALMLVLLDTGLKVLDVASLKVSDLVLESGSLHIPSGENIKLSEETIAELARLTTSRAGQALLFEGRCGKPVTARWERCVMDKLMKITGIEEQG
jgi:integrase